MFNDCQSLFIYVAFICKVLVVQRLPYEEIDTKTRIQIPHMAICILHRANILGKV